MRKSSTLDGAAEPIAVGPAQAGHMMNVGRTRLYEILKSGELEFYHDGRSLKITTASIKARTAQLLATEATRVAENPTARATTARRAKRAKSATAGA
jgi:hypothetical protein